MFRVQQTFLLLRPSFPEMCIWWWCTMCNINTSLHWFISPSLQDFGPLSSVQAESMYERKMQSVFNLVLEEVESLSRKHPPVSYLVKQKSSCWSDLHMNLNTSSVVENLFLFVFSTLAVCVTPSSRCSKSRCPSRGISSKNCSLPVSKWVTALHCFTVNTWINP